MARLDQPRAEGAVAVPSFAAAYERKHGRPLGQTTPTEARLEFGSGERWQQLRMLQINFGRFGLTDSEMDSLCSVETSVFEARFVTLSEAVGWLADFHPNQPRRVGHQLRTPDMVLLGTSPLNLIRGTAEDQEALLDMMGIRAKRRIDHDGYPLHPSQS